MAHEHAAATLDGMMSMIESLSELKDREEAAQKHFSAATSLLEKLPGLVCDAGKMLKTYFDTCATGRFCVRTYVQGRDRVNTCAAGH